MRVVVCTIVHHPADARIYHRQIRALLDAGHEVTYIAPVDPQDFYPERTRLSLQLKAVPRASGRRRTGAIRAARSALARHAADADLLLIHDPELLLALPARRRRPPVIWDVHEDPAAALSTKPWLPRPLRPPAAVAVHTAERMAERYVHLILAERGYVARFARPHPVVPNTTYVPDVPAPPGDDRRVVYVGHLSPDRGTADMIELARLLRGARAGLRGMVSLLERLLDAEPVRRVLPMGRVSSFAECPVIKPPAGELKICPSGSPASRTPPGDYIWHAPQVHDLAGGPVSAANDALLRDFAVRAVEAQPFGYLHAVLGGLALAVEWPPRPYPDAGTVYYYYFHLTPQTIPADHSWIPGGTAYSDAAHYGHATPSRVVEPFAILIDGYERVFYVYGPLFGLILVVGLGGVVRIQRRPPRLVRLAGSRRAGSMLPWITAVVLLVFPIAVADFDYRYLLPVLPFACLAAGLAFAPARSAGPGVRAGRVDREPSPAVGVALPPATPARRRSAYPEHG